MAQGNIKPNRGGTEVLIGLSRRDLQELQVAHHRLKASMEAGYLSYDAEAAAEALLEWAGFADTALAMLYAITEKKERDHGPST